MTGWESATSREIRIAKVAIKGWVNDAMSNNSNQIKTWVDNRIENKITNYHNRIMKPWVMKKFLELLKKTSSSLSRIVKL